MSVQAVEERTPRLVAVTLGGPELDGFVLDEPAASVRLLLPEDGTTDVVIPEWNGNEFRHADGARATIRTLTPRRFDASRRALDLEFVVHGHGAASAWATTVAVGAGAAISGPGRGYVVDSDARDYLVAGDETAIPAISQLLEVLPAAATVRVHIEIATPEARLPMPEHAGAVVVWHDADAGARPGDALVTAALADDIDAATRVWVAGEAAAVQRIRRELFETRGLSREHTTIRGYWKLGRAAT